MTGAIFEKSCRSCRVVKPMEEYLFQATCRNGRKPVCRECTNLKAKEYRKNLPEGVKYAQDRKIRLKLKYGITVEDYDRMHLEQGGTCAICHRTEEDIGKKLAVDHCHKTGKVRGLLCFICNSAIGKLDDDPIKLIKAAEYLMSNSSGRWKK